MCNVKNNFDVSGLRLLIYIYYIVLTCMHNHKLIFVIILNWFNTSAHFEVVISDKYILTENHRGTSNDISQPHNYTLLVIQLESYWSLI